MPSTLPIKKPFSFVAVLLTIFLLIVAGQWAHFVFYFKQESSIAFIWSLVDWAIWFGLFICLLLFLKRYQKFTPRFKLTLIIAVILLAGPTQILITTSIYKIVFNSSDSLFDSMLRMMNKRWLQNLFISSVFLFICEQLLQDYKTKQQEAKSPEPIPYDDRILIDDGKSQHLFHPNDIDCFVSSKNYVSIYSNTDEIVTRATLKSISTLFTSAQFIQISRSAFINVKRVKTLKKYSKTSYEAHLINGQTLNVSKNYLKQFVTALKQHSPSSLTS